MICVLRNINDHGEKSTQDFAFSTARVEIQLDDWPLSLPFLVQDYQRTIQRTKGMQQSMINQDTIKYLETTAAATTTTSRKRAIACATARARVCVSFVSGPLTHRSIEKIELK